MILRISERPWEHLLSELAERVLAFFPSHATGREGGTAPAALVHGI